VFLNVRDICLIGMLVAVIVFCAQLSIPFPGGVPFSLQTFGIALAGITLGAKRGAVAAAVYILLGAVGVPVFVHFSGGLHHIAGPTGGFILSFPLIALFAGLGAKSERVLVRAAWIAGGLGLNYVCGLLFFNFVTGLGLRAGFMVAVLPFLLFDVVRVGLLVTVGWRVRRALERSGYLH